MTRHSHLEENKCELPGSIPAWSGDGTPRSTIKEGGKVTPTLPTLLPRRSLSSESGGGSIPPLEAVSRSTSSRLFLLVSVEGEPLQQHSVTLTDNTSRSERTRDPAKNLPSGALQRKWHGSVGGGLGAMGRAPNEARAPLVSEVSGWFDAYAIWMVPICTSIGSASSS